MKSFKQVTAVKDIPMKSIHFGAWNYARENAMQPKIERIKNKIKSEKPMPAILVTKYHGKWALLDGHHRYWAHKDLGKTHIKAELWDGKI